MLLLLLFWLELKKLTQGKYIYVDKSNCLRELYTQTHTRRTKQLKSNELTWKRIQYHHRHHTGRQVYMIHLSNAYRHKTRTRRREKFIFSFFPFHYKWNVRLIFFELLSYFLVTSLFSMRILLVDWNGPKNFHKQMKKSKINSKSWTIYVYLCLNVHSRLKR